MRIEKNCINEYRAIYLKIAKEVLRAQRPSSANSFTHLMFCSCEVNGAATEII